jgi:hypothetical protein
MSFEGEPLESLAVLRMAARAEDLVDGLRRGALKVESLLSLVGIKGDRPVGVHTEEEHSWLIKKASKMILVARGRSNGLDRRRDVSGDNPNAVQRVVLVVGVTGDVLGSGMARTVSRMPLKSLPSKVMAMPMFKHLFKPKTRRKKSFEAFSEERSWRVVRT